MGRPSTFSAEALICLDIFFINLALVDIHNRRLIDDTMICDLQANGGQTLSLNRSKPPKKKSTVGISVPNFVT
jgi:hypothetical protein